MPMIAKYPLPLAQGEIHDIEMPADARVLTCQAQGIDPCLWALVDPANDTVVRRFMLVGTGWPIDIDLVDSLTHIGTAQTPGFVWHVFEVGQ